MNTQKEDIDKKHRVLAIVGASSGNLVEWFDFYVYSFCAIYFAPVFFPSGNPTTQLLNTAGVFAAGFLMRPIGGWLFGRIKEALQEAGNLCYVHAAAEGHPDAEEELQRFYIEQVRNRSSVLPLESTIESESLRYTKLSRRPDDNDIGSGGDNIQDSLYEQL